MKKTKGFTLIELIVTMAILGLLIGIGALRFDFLSNYQEKIEIESVVKAINEARNSAISSGYAYSVKFSERENMIQINSEIESVKNGNKDAVFSENLYLQKLKVVGEDNIVKFNATGAPDNPGKYQLNGSKKKYIITIEIATGKVNLIEKEI